MDNVVKSFSAETPTPETGVTEPKREQEPQSERPSEGPATPALPSSVSLAPELEVITVPSVQLPVKSQLQKEIEDVLEEDLETIYWELSEPERLIFRHKGEETASKIRLLLGETTVRVQEVFRLIIEWLKLLPGVSKFFIEREAKIKTDKILRFR